MNLETALSRLAAVGTAQNRKVYPRHGIREPMFGVSFRELGRLQREIGEDDELAEQLWATGNHDARMLATRIASPRRTTMERLTHWVVDVDNYVLADAVAALAARCEDALECLRAWWHLADEWPSTVAFDLVQKLALEGKLDDVELETILEYIEHNIHGMANRTRYAMNGALIAIGGQSERLRAAAIAAADRIGAVHVDHGETGCQTPGAADYIRKVAMYQSERAKGHGAPLAAAKARQAAARTGKTEARKTPAKKTPTKKTPIKKATRKASPRKRPR